MQTDPNVTLTNPPSRKRRRYWIYIMVLLVIGLLVLGFPYLRAIPLLWAKPTIKVDYLAECNRLSKPEGFDPNQNAGPYYDKLFAAFKPLPEILQDKWRVWPTDLNDVEQEALKTWAPLNQEALTYLSQAAQQPYWWYEMKLDGCLSNWTPPSLEERRAVTWGSLFLANLGASQGEMKSAFDLLLDLHTMGTQLEQASTLVDQLVGLAICRAVHTAILQIEDRCIVPAVTQETVMKTLDAHLGQVRVPRFSKVEACLMYDWLQRTFTDDGKGSGRPIPRLFYKQEMEAGRITSFREAIRICAAHPDRATTLHIYDSCIAAATTLAEETPWSMESQGTNYQEKLQQIVERNYTMDILGPTLSRIMQLGWTARIEGKATVVILATRIYRIQKGHLPDSLSELVTSDLLKEVPMDPFSDGPLVYKRTSDTFILYSVGDNFKDDGGQPGKWRQDPPMGDIVFLACSACPK